MMRRLLVFGSSLFAAALVLVAQTNVNSFKWLILYEPEIPESMR
jgi:cyclic lactone autoinducer peptide